MPPACNMGRVGWFPEIRIKDHQNMAVSLAAEIKQRLLALVQEHYQIELTDLATEIPPKTELGDLAFPVAFDLAKRLKAATGEKKNPRELANTLAEGLRAIPGVARVEIAGPGYLNLFFDRASMFAQLVDEPFSVAPLSAATGTKIIVEHTSINPNKAAHIGHVRNSVLGDTTARILKAVGENVEVHNYIDNTGVQVADVVVGFIHLEQKALEEIREIAERTQTKRSDAFDYYCWDLYARVGAWYEEDKSRLAIRAQTLHEIEAGNNPTAEIGEYISNKIVNCHLNTMTRLDISYDLLARESEILHLHFWAHAFEKLKARGVIVFEEEGRNKGCWVMRAETSDDRPQTSDQEEEHDADKIIVRSNGTVTYTGKDIAYHLWKLGKLGLDFNYHLLRHDHNGHPVWVTTGQETSSERRSGSKPLASSNPPAFGNGTAFLNVIDVGQSYPQANVKRAVLLMAESDEQRAKVARSAHLAYEKVTLSADAAKELGVDAEGSVSMSGRKGLGVKADDLIDRLTANALQEVQTRHTELGADVQQKIAHQIAVAALRYFILKFTRTSIIAFDFAEALKFRGETGPYLQYSVRRLSNIFTELGLPTAVVHAEFNQLTPEDIAAQFTGEAGDVLWSLVYFASRLNDVVQQAANAFEPTLVAKFAYQLADQFNTFYQDKRFHILKEPDAKRKTVLLMAVEVVRRKLDQALTLLGIEVPEKM